MATPTRRRSRLFALDDDLFFLDESPFFRVELAEVRPAPQPEPDEPLPALEQPDEDDLDEDTLADYDGPIQLSIGVPVLVEEDEEDDTMEVIKPRPFVIHRVPEDTAPLRREIVLLVASVCLVVLSGLIWA